MFEKSMARRDSARRSDEAKGDQIVSGRDWGRRTFARLWDKHRGLHDWPKDTAQRKTPICHCRLQVQAHALQQARPAPGGRRLGPGSREGGSERALPPAGRDRELVAHLLVSSEE